jgi:hypothetical protein
MNSRKALSFRMAASARRLFSSRRTSPILFFWRQIGNKLIWNPGAFASRRRTGLEYLVKMFMRNRFIISMLVGAISACSTAPRAPSVKMDDLSPEQLGAVHNVKIYSPGRITGQQFTVLKGIEGVSCKDSFWGNAATKRDAILQTQYMALQAGADGIINLQCETPRDASARYDCSKVVICTGEAIKSSPGEGPDRVKPPK